MGAAVSSLKLPYVNSYRDRHGRIRHYVRRAGMKNVALPDDPTTAEFMQAYREALGLKPNQSVPRKIGGAPGTMGALIAEYKKAPDFCELKESTRAEYSRYLDRIDEKFGHQVAGRLSRANVLKIRDDLAETPRVANWHVQLLSRLMSFAIDRGYRRDNPAAKVRLLKARRRYEAWTKAELLAFEAAYPTGTRERLAYALLRYIGQRRGDVATMTWHDYDGSAIQIVQGKTDEPVWLPCPAELRAELEAAKAAERKGVTILVGERGGSFTSKNLGVWLGRKIRDIGIAKTVHGLRTTVAKEHAEAGSSAREIASITGHKTLRMVEHYTQDADRKKMARSASKRLDRARKRLVSASKKA